VKLVKLITIAIMLRIVGSTLSLVGSGECNCGCKKWVSTCQWLQFKVESRLELVNWGTNVETWLRRIYA